MNKLLNIILSRWETLAIDLRLIPRTMNFLNFTHTERRLLKSLTNQLQETLNEIKEKLDGSESSQN